MGEACWNAIHELENNLGLAHHPESSRKWLFRTFWNRVWAALTEGLRCQGFDQQWVVIPADDIFVADSGFKIRWQNEGEGNNQERFAVYVQSVAGNGPFQTQYGITRGVVGLGVPNPPVPLNPRDEALRNNLIDRGFPNGFNILGAANAEWVAYRTFHLHPGVPNFNLDVCETVLTLCNEEVNPAKPLTTRVVDLIWVLFAENREALEDLNQDFPY